MGALPSGDLQVPGFFFVVLGGQKDTGSGHQRPMGAVFAHKNSYYAAESNKSYLNTKFMFYAYRKSQNLAV